MKVEYGRVTCQSIVTLLWTGETGLMLCARRPYLLSHSTLNRQTHIAAFLRPPERERVASQPCSQQSHTWTRSVGVQLFQGRGIWENDTNLCNIPH
jgi:hypothetical protein